MVGGHGASANAHELLCIQYHRVISVHKTNEVSNLLKEEGVKDIISNENCKIREEDTCPIPNFSGNSRASTKLSDSSS